jgi:pimeloyl-ACP methyl ester carboxylesterase
MVPLICIIETRLKIPGVGGKLFLTVSRVRRLRSISILTIGEIFPSRLETIFWRQKTATEPGIIRFILVSAALADRGGTRRLAAHLGKSFTIINYDRRGRGRSGNTPPYAVQREIEDIETLIDASGGSAFLFGSSSGSVLALDAARKLEPKVKRLFLYEPPFIVDNSHPPLPDDLATNIEHLAAAGHRNDAVRMFFTKGMGIPGPAVTIMRYVMPGWSNMTDMAHTVPYDLAILSGTQSGKPLPATRWADLTAPTLVAVGSRSEAFFHHGAQALVRSLPHARYLSLQGRDHSAVLFAPQALAAAMTPFFSSESDSISSYTKTSLGH